MILHLFTKTTPSAAWTPPSAKFSSTNPVELSSTEWLDAGSGSRRRYGAKITEKEDGLIINGQSNFNSAEVDSETDHRVSMSLAIASLLAKGTSKIMRADAASVSYPTFWEDLAKLTN